jgi:hypothetical protein
MILRGSAVEEELGVSLLGMRTVGIEMKGLFTVVATSNFGA